MRVLWQSVSFPANRTHVYMSHRPKGGQLGSRGSQGGGVYVAEGAVANFKDSNIYDNDATNVCSPSSLA